LGYLVKAQTNVENSMADEEDINEAEDTENEEGSDVEGLDIPRKKGKKKLLFILLPILILIGAAVGLYFSGMLDSLIGKENVEESEVDIFADAGFKKTIFYELPEIVVNLNAPPSQPQHKLTVQISMEIEKQIDVALIESIMPKIIDNFQVYLRELRMEDLQGAAGLYKLREELLFRINDEASPASITNIMFTKMLVEPMALVE
jgi:flagellar FliL protein